jgi:dTMP kinase
MPVKRSHSRAAPSTVPRRISDLVRSHEKQRGLLIAFEGPDGAGKTTQRRLFKTWLEHEGHSVVVAKSTSSRAIKPLLKARTRLRALSAEELCLLHAADFRHRLETEILPALWQGKVVLADRFLFTSLARASARGLDLDWLLAAHAPLFWPDLVYYFAVSAETSTTRVAATRAPKYYDAGQDVTRVADPIGSYRRFIGRMIREYESLALIFQFVTIDGEQPIYEQHRHIRRLFQEGQRRPWGQWNQEAIADWLAWSPSAAEVRDGATARR